MKLGPALLIALVLFLAPATAHAQEPRTGALVRIDGDTTLASGETADVVMVIDGNAIIDGVVEDFLLVIDGDAIITGEVRGNVTVVNGRLILRSGSTIEDANLIESELEQDSGATVTGDIDRDSTWIFPSFGIASAIYFWLAFAILMLVLALFFAAIGGSQLRRAAAALTREPAQTILGAVIVWVGVPILGVLVLLTIVGIPLGLTILLFLLPLLWLLGYVVTATRIGQWITDRLNVSSQGHPYLPALLGVLFLQVLTLVPIIGWIIVAFSGLWGAGALALIAWRAIRSRGAEPPAVDTPELQPGPV